MDSETGSRAEPTKVADGVETNRAANKLESKEINEANIETVLEDIGLVLPVKHSENLVKPSQPSGQLKPTKN